MLLGLSVSFYLMYEFKSIEEGIWEQIFEHDTVCMVALFRPTTLSSQLI